MKGRLSAQDADGGLTVPSPSFIADMEEVAELVSDWAVEVVGKAVDALMPDGRPWNTIEQTMDERLQEYLALRGNQQAWDEYRLEQAVEIATRLMNNGLDESDVLGLHPYDIATKFAAKWSYDMEVELVKRASKMRGQHAL